MSWYRWVGERLRALLGRAREDADMHEELRFHIDMETEKYIRRGMPPAEARRRALIAFGGVERFAEQTRDERGVRPLEDFWRDLRFAFRQLRRRPVFSLVTALTIGLGIGATVLGFLVADAVVFRPLPYPEADRLVRIQELTPNGGGFSLSDPNYLDLASAVHGFSGTAAFTMRRMALLGGSEPYQVQGLAVTPGYFGVLGLDPVLGRAFRPSDAPAAQEGAVAVLSYGVWRRLFASDPDILGKSINLDGATRTVVGVAPSDLRPFLGEEVWVPFGPDPAHSREDRWLEAIGRLAPGTTLSQARQELSSLAARLGADYPDSNADWGFRVRSFPDWLIGPGVQRTVSILSVAGILLLLLSCASVSALLLARVSARQRDVALRSVLGASASRLVRQLLVESLVLAAVGAVVGIVIVALVVPVLRHVGPTALPRLDEVDLRGRALAVALLSTVGAGVLAGLAPAVLTVRGRFARLLHESSRTVTDAGRRMRNLLVGAQIALAVVLLVAAGLLLSTFVRLGQVDPGYDPDGVLAVSISPPSDRYPMGQRPVGIFYDGVLEGVRAIPGVVAAGAYNVRPFSGFRPANKVAADERSSTVDDFVPIQWRSVTPGFFEAMRIPLIRGRYLEARDDSRDAFVTAMSKGDAPLLPVVITTPLARRLWPEEDAVGRRLAWNRPGTDTHLVVIGVVAPIRDMRLTAEPRPMVFLPNGLVGFPEMTLFVRVAGDAESVAGAVRKAVWAVDADTPVPAITPLADALDGARAGARLNLVLIGALGLVALLLAALSTYGVVSFATGQRTHEIGVRIALGAAGRDVVGPIVGQTLKVVFLGAAVGVIGALTLTRYLGSTLFGIEPTNPGTYVVVLATLGFAALAASYLPARRAARVDPREALRAE